MKFYLHLSLAALAWLGLVASEASDCRLYFRPARVCKHFKYTDGSCTKGLETSCKPFRTTFNEKRCPHFVCKTTTTPNTPVPDSSLSTTPSSGREVRHLRTIEQPPSSTQVTSSPPPRTAPSTSTRTTSTPSWPRSTSRALSRSTTTLKPSTRTRRTTPQQSSPVRSTSRTTPRPKKRIALTVTTTRSTTRKTKTARTTSATTSSSSASTLLPSSTTVTSTTASTSTTSASTSPRSSSTSTARFSSARSLTTSSSTSASTSASTTVTSTTSSTSTTSTSTVPRSSSTSTPRSSSPTRSTTTSTTTTLTSSIARYPARTTPSAASTTHVVVASSTPTASGTSSRATTTSTTSSARSTTSRRSSRSRSASSSSRPTPTPRLAAKMSRKATKRPEQIRDLMDLTCDDGRICTLSWEFLSTCTIFVKDQKHPHCNVPCRMEDCKKEVHFSMNCPIYYCSWPPTPPGNTTTTTTTTTSTTTTPTSTTSSSPRPPPRPSGCSGAYATSVTFNVVFAVLLFVIFGRKILKRRIRQHQDQPIIRRSQGLVNPLYEGEAEPLLARISFRRRRPTREPDLALSGFDAAAARFIDPSEPPTFEPESSTMAEPSSPTTLSDFAGIDLEAGGSGSRPSLLSRLKAVFKNENDSL